MTRVLAHGPADRLDLRYPSRIWLEEEAVAVERAVTPEDDVGGAVVDGDVAAAVTYLGRRQRVLLSPGTVRELLSRRPDLLEDTGSWCAWLPHGLAAEVVAARELLAEDAIGRVAGGDLVTLVGAGVATGPTWEADTAVSLDRFEAVVTGLDLLRQLGLEVAHSAASERPAGARAIEHHLADGGVVRQRIEDADLYAVPAFTGELRGEGGRLLLRHELAPGAVTVWRRSTRAFHAPALPKIKPNIQAPDTLRGGPETARQLAGAVTGDPATTVPPSVALELIAGAIQLDPDPSGPEASDVH